MAEYVEFSFADGTVVALQAFPPVGQGTDDYAVPGFGSSLPVSRGRLVTATDTALRTVLAPLVPVLESIHDTVAAAPNPPQRLQVSLGVRIGHDLKLGVVGATGEASLTITADWDLPRPAPTQSP
ncbi:hypothetical protein EDD99_0495 [Streptomyces sp. 846.5]|nr:CU044_2847 family protein [Streptomyces sp. 846.5]TDU02110.1 hypothetical protein EDD99_0495 [Streptomyces sp. 846.5]